MKCKVAVLKGLFFPIGVCFLIWCILDYGLFHLVDLKDERDPPQQNRHQGHYQFWFIVSTVAAISVWTNPILCTKSPNFTMLFYYIKMQTSSSLYHPFLQLTGAFKGGTVWIIISNGVETTHGQSKSFDIYLIKDELLTLTMRSFYTSWDRSSYSISF